MLNTSKFNSRVNSLLALTVSLLWSSHAAAQSMAIPMPKIPSSAPENSVPMGSAAEFTEVALDFPIAAGPYQPTWSSIEENHPGTPTWLREAKFGIWVHFGPPAPASLSRHAARF